MRVARIALLAGCVVGCVGSNTIPCGDALCPTDFTCIEGVCVAPGDACGNHHVDVALDEVCDDGNQIDGDGCSADCRSDEACGNDRVDALADVPEVCECHGADCVVADEVCTAYGADFGLLTCGAAGSADACQLAFDACETFGFRQRASADALRVRLHGTDVIALDRLGRLAIYAGEDPQPVPPIGPDVTVNDAALLGDVIYAVASDSSVYRWPIAAPAWEALFTAPNTFAQVEAFQIDAGTVDLVVRTTRGAVEVHRGTAAGWAPRGSTIQGALVAAAGADAYLITETALERFDPVTPGAPWAPITIVLSPAENVVDAARIDGVDWVTTTLGRVLAIDPVDGSVSGSRPVFFPASTPLRFLPGAGVTVYSDARVAAWNGAAWHLTEPALFAPIQSTTGGAIQVIADARGLQIRQPREYQAANAGSLAIIDAVTGPGAIYFTNGSEIYSYDGVELQTFDPGALTAVPPVPDMVPFIRSWCGFADGSYVASNDLNLVSCTTAGCAAPVPVPIGSTSLLRVRCTVGPRWAWVVTGDSAGRPRVHRYDAATQTLANAPVIANVESINELATITNAPNPALVETIVVGRDAGAAAVWTVTGTDTAMVRPHDELAELMSVHACGSGEWLAGGVTIEGNAAVLRHRVGGEDLIELPRAQPIVALSGTCDAFYAATRTDLLYVADGVVTPVRWPFLESLVAIDADDAGTPDPRDDSLVIGSRSAARALR